MSMFVASLLFLVHIESINELASTEVPVIGNSMMLSNDYFNLTMIKIKLTNGSVLEYSTIDEAILSIYNSSNRIELLDNVSEVLIMPFTKYLEYKKQNISIAENESYLPGYELFFSQLSNPIDYNYSGRIIATDESEFFYNLYGIGISKTFLYGRLLDLNITKLDGTTYDFQDNDLIVLCYLNMSENEFAINQLEELNETLSIISDSRLKIVVIDISNSLTVNNSLISDFPELTFVNDENTSLVNNTYGTFTVFNFSYHPAFVYMFGDLFVWRKTIGFEKAEIIGTYIKGALSDGMGFVFSYVIQDISAWNLRELEEATVAISVIDGFGNVTLQLEYTVLDENNETIKQGIETKDIEYSQIVSFVIDIPNNSRILNIAVKIYRGSNIEFATEAEFAIEFSVSEERQPTFPWDLVAMAIILIATIGASLIVIKKYK